MIPMVDLKSQYHALKHEIDQGISEVLQNCQFILGPNVSALESEICEYLDAKHAVACASGTDALHLALLAAGIGPGDEVITTAFTFIATAEAIGAVGATPVFVDILPDTFNIDPAAVAKAITPKTKAILPVHLFGQPADLPTLQSLCDRHGLLLIEDCAQSFGASIGAQMTGSTGAFGCFSFFPSKNLGCYGDGGLVTTQSAEMAERLRMYRNHGSHQRYHHDVIGINSRLDEIQAVILRTKLKHIDDYNHERRRVAQTYRKLFQGTEVQTPVEDGIGQHVYHQYTTLMPKREEVMEHLQQQGIACAIYYPIPLHKQKAFEATVQPSLPVTESVVTHCLSLPIFPEMSEEQIVRVVDAVKEVL